MSTDIFGGKLETKALSSLSAMMTDVPSLQNTQLYVSAVLSLVVVINRIALYRQASFDRGIKFFFMFQVEQYLKARILLNQLYRLPENILFASKTVSLLKMGRR